MICYFGVINDDDDVVYTQVYFMSPSRETSWSLPLSISLELDADQQDFIRDLVYEFEQRTKRTAQAKMALGGKITGITSLPKETTGDEYINPSRWPTAQSAVPPADRPVSIFPPESWVSDRPVSLFPPESCVTPKTDRSSASRQSPSVEYMSMQGTKQL